MTRLLLFLFFILVSAQSVSAQIYRTQYRAPGQNWMEINTEHFRLIYPERYRQEAIRSLLILENEYSDIQQLVGGNLQKFPVLLNPENDRSNGFVSPFNFRSEVELAPMKGKALNPRSGNWLESVLPHELVHALHMSVNPASVTGLIGLLSKDFRRSIHGAAPMGLIEGIAVHYESHGTIEQSGRGNYPYFRNQFNALLNTDQEWSMGQLVHASDYTLPFNRHYIGGYEFSSWLLEQYGWETMKEAIDYHFKYPFLGFGMALRYATGSYPKTLYRQFSEQRKEEEQQRLRQFDSRHDVMEEVPFFAKCRRMQRPLWLDNETLIFYGLSCNKPAGFYTWKSGQSNPKLLKEVVISGDHQYALSPGRDELLYSRYHPSMFYDNLFRGDLHSLTLQTGESTHLTQNARLFSPEFSGDEILALQTEGYQQNLVRLDSGRTIQTIPKADSSTVVGVAANPEHSGQLAVLGKVKSVQAIWFENAGQTDTLFSRPPDIAFPGGSLFDPAWHPSGEKLLFVSDHTGTMNVYEYDVSGQQITQVTNSRYNAFEASYSPDGKTIAYVGQSENERKLYVMNADQAAGTILARGEWNPGAEIREQLNRPLMSRGEQAGSGEWNPEPYRAGFSWLQPRLWMPLYEQQNGYDRIGLNLQSVDVLNSQAYSLELTHFADRVWFDAAYKNKSLYPGFTIRLFNEPYLDFFTVQRNEERDTELLLRQSRGGSVRFPFQFRLESNARFSAVYFEPEYSVSQIRFLNPDAGPEPYSEFALRHSVGFWNIIYAGLRQFSRDIQPNRGWAFFTEVKTDLNTDEITGGGDDFTLRGSLTRRQGFRAGVSAFAAPLQKYNQSLRVTLQAVTQTRQPVFNTFSLYSGSFSETPFPGANNTAILNTRYTIPLTYPDNGGFLVPVYLSNLYLVLFSQTATDLSKPGLFDGSRSVFGGGVRSRFRISNLGFDVGIMIGWEPTRNNVTYRFGTE